MSDPNLPPPPGEGQQPPGGTPPPPGSPPPPASPPPPGQGGYPPPASPPPPGQGGYPPPASPPPPGQGGYGAPPPGGYGAPPPGGFAPPPAQPYQPGAPGGVAMGPAGMVLADSGKRLIARLIDFGILIVFVVVVQFVAVAAIVSTSSSNSSTFGFNGISFVIAIGLYVVYWLYESLMASSRGQTVGKIIMKIKIVDANGNNPETSAAMKRSLVWLVPLVPCCIGWLAFLGLEIWGIVNIFNTPERRTLFDTFAETWVVDAP